MSAARLDRGFRRVLVHRESSTTGVTAGDVVTGAIKAQPVTMRFCPLGLVAAS